MKPIRHVDRVLVARDGTFHRRRVPVYPAPEVADCRPYYQPSLKPQREQQELPIDDIRQRIEEAKTQIDVMESIARRKNAMRSTLSSGFHARLDVLKSRLSRLKAMLRRQTETLRDHRIS